MRKSDVRQNIRTLAIDVFTTPNFQKEDRYAFVLEMADEPVVADTIAPQTLLFATKRSAEVARFCVDARRSRRNR